MTGFQVHSATSRAAAYQSEMNQLSDCEKIHQILIIRGIEGMTADEAAVACTISPGTASARMRQLQLQKRAKKSVDIRKTRAGRPANVWKLPEFVLFEADTKRDKSGEALDLLNTFRGQTRSESEVKEFVEKLHEILK